MRPPACPARASYKKSNSWGLRRRLRRDRDADHAGASLLGPRLRTGMPCGFGWDAWSG
jgi:hypothetical protein